MKEHQEGGRLVARTLALGQEEINETRVRITAMPWLPKDTLSSAWAWVIKRQLDSESLLDTG